MPKSRRTIAEAYASTLDPPDQLTETQEIVRVGKACGNNLYEVNLPHRQDPLLVELPTKFRSTIFVRRGGYALIDTANMASRGNKIEGEIVTIVGDEKVWRKMPWWPVEFKKQNHFASAEEDSEQDLMLPPTSDDD